MKLGTSITADESETALAIESVQAMSASPCLRDCLCSAIAPGRLGLARH
jgi:hypothetical protein